MVPPAPEGVHVSLPVPAAVRATRTMAGSRGHALPVSWLAAPQQLASRRDLDLSHAEASHAGADVGLQGLHDNQSRLATHKERRSAERSAMAAGHTSADKEKQRNLHLVGRREIKNKNPSSKTQQKIFVKMKANLK